MKGCTFCANPATDVCVGCDITPSYLCDFHQEPCINCGDGPYCSRCEECLECDWLCPGARICHECSEHVEKDERTNCAECSVYVYHSECLRRCQWCPETREAHYLCSLHRCEACRLVDGIDTTLCRRANVPSLVGYSHRICRKHRKRALEIAEEFVSTEKKRIKSEKRHISDPVASLPHSEKN